VLLLVHSVISRNGCSNDLLYITLHALKTAIYTQFGGYMTLRKRDTQKDWIKARDLSIWGEFSYHSYVRVL
jgi:hypothetical protein